MFNRDKTIHTSWNPSAENRLGHIDYVMLQSMDIRSRVVAQPGILVLSWTPKLKRCAGSHHISDIAYYLQTHAFTLLLLYFCFYLP